MKIAVIVYPRPTWEEYKDELLVLSDDDYKKLIKMTRNQICEQGNEPYDVAFIPHAYKEWLGNREDTSVSRAEWATAQIVD